MEQPRTNPNVFDDFFRGLRRRRAFKIFMGVFRRTLLFLIVLLFVLYLILQIKPVQNWLVTKATEQISEGLQTDVSIDEIDFKFFDKLVLKDLFIADLNGDTLLFTKELNTSMSANLLALVNGRFDLDEIHLQGTKINLDIRPYEYENNLKKLLVNLENFKRDRDSNKVNKPIYLDLQTISFEDIELNNTNRSRGFYQFFKIPSGSIGIEKIDLSNIEILLDNIVVNNPDVTIELHPAKDTAAVGEEIIGPNGPENEDEILPHIAFESLKIIDGQFTFNNIRRDPVKSTPDTIIDYRHLFANDINIELGASTTNTYLYETELINLALKEQSGFQLNRMASKEVKIDNRKAIFNDIIFQTPYSTLGDTIVLKYRQFMDIDYFNDRVRMDARIKDSKIALSDLMNVAPGLKNNAFFQKNKREEVDISGRFTGRVNNLRGRDVQLRLNDGTNLAGNFRSRDLTIKGEEVLNLELDYFRSDMQTIRLLLPDFNPPDNFDKLGKFDFNGRFDGFFADFVAYGALQTDLGAAEVDMQMVLTQGREFAEYSGKISLDEFNLGAWADNPDFGVVSFQSEVAKGYGLTLETVNTELTANIDEFDFRGYKYENAVMEGRISKNLFDGDLLIKDKNVDLTFSGAVQFGDTIPEFDFSAQVTKLDLKAVNLTDRPISFRGNLDLNLIDKDIAKIRGTAQGSKLIVIETGVDTFVLDSLNLNTALLPNGDRRLSFFSEILKAEINGEYVLDEIPEAFLQYFEKNFTQFSNRLNIKPKRNLTVNANFDYDVEIPDSKNFFKLLDPKLGRVQDAKFAGVFDTRASKIVLNLDLPEFNYDNLFFKEIIVSIDGDNTGNNVYFEVAESQINNITLEPITLRGDLYKDTLSFQLNALSWTSILDNLQMKGLFTVNEEFFNIQFLPSDLAIFREKWRIGEDNYIRFDKDYLDVQNVRLTNDNRSIELSSINHKGLSAQLNNFDFSIIDEYWDYPQLDFNGNFGVSASVDQIFDLSGLRLNVSADTLYVNGEDWGVMQLNAQAPNIKSEAYAYFSITQSDGQLTAEGNVIPPALRKTKDNSKFPGIDFDVSVNRFPVHIAEYWLGNGISNTTGNFDAGWKLTGPLNNIEVDGDIRIYDAAVTIDILKTRYFIDDDRAKVNSFLFDVTGATITDELGNVANLKGGITHDHLRNLGLDVVMSSNNFLALNTNKNDNKTFYGYAIADGDVKFTGSFKKPNILIDAAPKPGTNIIIPVNDEREASEVTFIDFIDKSDTISSITQATELLGVYMDMKLALNDNALMELVFDEKSGDIIKGRGNGDVQLILDRQGEFTMNGNYFINSGQYLFTAFSLVNKPFEIQEGGSIFWTGDPYNAEINIDADYLGVKASVYNFISEYPDLEQKEQLKLEARQPVNIDLSMNLSGELLSPKILFSLGFPSLTGELRNYVDNKLVNINRNPNELNRQVFGLITLGSFIPSNQGLFAGNSVGTIAANTLSEFISSQLSSFITDFFADKIKEGKFITGVEFAVGYDRIEGSFSSADPTQYNNIGVRPKVYLADGRVSIEAGGGVNFGQGATTTYFGGDLIVEWAISEDRRFKIKGFTLYDSNVLGARNQSGVGLTYRREGDSLKELLSRKKKIKAKAKKEDPVLEN